MGGGVHRLAARVGRICAEAPGGAGAEPPADAGGPGGFVGPRHPAHQHAVPEGPPHAGVRQGLACAHRLQVVPGHAHQPVLVDAPAPRRQAVEPEQLPHRRHPGVGRRGGHPGAHAVQGHLLPHLGGPVLGEGVRCDSAFGAACCVLCAAAAPRLAPGADKSTRPPPQASRRA